MTASARQRMVDAAFALFDEHGYDATTVDEIVERAGVSRSTFFRAFGSKEDVIFPRHDEVQARIEARLGTGTPETYPLALREAAALVLEQYLEEGALALSRYRLTRGVPALRDREIASMLGYQRLFREAARGWLDGPDAELRAELLAAAVVTAHNVVLRRWLRGETDPAGARREFAAAMGTVLTRPTGTGSDAGSTVVVMQTGQSLEELLPALRRALAESDGT